MARYRVLHARTITGYELKAAYVYAAGDVVDDATTPAAHIEQLAGVLEKLSDDTTVQGGDTDAPAKAKARA